MLVMNPFSDQSKLSSVEDQDIKEGYQPNPQDLVQKNLQWPIGKNGVSNPGKIQYFQWDVPEVNFIMSQDTRKTLTVSVNLR